MELPVKKFEVNDRVTDTRNPRKIGVIHNTSFSPQHNWLYHTKWEDNWQPEWMLEHLLEALGRKSIWVICETGTSNPWNKIVGWAVSEQEVREAMAKISRSLNMVYYVKEVKHV